VLSWGTIAYGAALSGIAAVIAVAFVLRTRERAVLVTSAVAGTAGPFVWNLTLHHTGGRFFVDAPGYVFPISLQDTGSGVFTTALAALLLGFGPLRTATGQRLATTALACGLAALLVDIYLY
jgi:hypothetical protein